MFAALLIAASLTTQELKIPRTPENIAWENRFKHDMRLRMTPVQKRDAERKYAEYRERLEPGRKLFQDIVKGDMVCPPELKAQKRVQFRETLASLEKTAKWWDAPASYRRWVKSYVQLGEEAIKKLDD